jgi:nitrogen fixation NifU-like protein
MALDLYAEEIISHYEHPHNSGIMKDANASFHNYNASCGDDVTVYLKLDKDKIVDAKFKGTGCAISVASASMLTDFVKGKSLKDVEAMNVKTIVEIIGIDPGPARLKCATLSLRTLKEAAFLYEHKEVDKETRSL